MKGSDCQDATQAAPAEQKQQAADFLSTYAPLTSDFPKDVLLVSERLTSRRYRESMYYGEMENGKREGWGVMVYPQRVYEGQWKTGLR